MTLEKLSTTVNGHLRKATTGGASSPNISGKTGGSSSELLAVTMSKTDILMQLASVLILMLGRSVNLHFWHDGSISSHTGGGSHC